jgi:hypothetical protein
MLLPRAYLGLCRNTRLVTHIKTPSLLYNHLGQDLRL